jgi:hypothetical protein
MQAATRQMKKEGKLLRPPEALSSSLHRTLVPSWPAYLSGCSGGSDLSVNCTAPLVYELRAHTPELLRLNRWYRDRTVAKTNGLNVTTKFYYEKRGIALGFLPIVDESSADPGVAGIRPVPVPADHFSICKFAAQGDWLYESVRQFFKDLFPMEVRRESSIEDGKIIELRLRGKLPKEIRVDVNVVGNENLTLVLRQEEDDG